MATTNSKRAPKAAAPDWKSKGSPDELGETDQIAHSIVTDRPDLMPSVALIMEAALDDDGRRRALELFRTAVQNPGDKHRDPRVAIAACSPSS